MKPSKSILTILRSKEELDNQFNETVQVRLFRLAGVAQSVLAKAQISRGFTQKEITENFHSSIEWFFDFQFGRKIPAKAPARHVSPLHNKLIISKVDESFIHCSKYERGEMTHFTILVESLALSDRDFAKIIRQGIRNVRAEESRIAHSSRMARIEEMEESIATMQRKLTREKELAEKHVQKGTRPKKQ